MKNFYPSILAIFLLAIPGRAFCWGSEGHKITGTIAGKYIDQKTRDSIRVYLGTTTLEQAAIWIDETKNDYLKPMHYLDIDKDGNYSCNGQGNIINELDKVLDELQERCYYPRERIAADLKILCHLIGDLHQPLHVGDGVDQWGNDVEVSFLKNPTNLHKLWDEDLIKYYNVPAKDCLITALNYSMDVLTWLERTDISGWMNESRLLLPVIYDFDDCEISDAYAEKNILFIENQLGFAGLRLAHVLTEIFEQ